jgi:hypothetical protein
MGTFLFFRVENSRAPISIGLSLGTSFIPTMRNPVQLVEKSWSIKEEKLTVMNPDAPRMRVGRIPSNARRIPTKPQGHASRMKRIIRLGKDVLRTVHRRGRFDEGLCWLCGLYCWSDPPKHGKREVGLAPAMKRLLSSCNAEGSAPFLLPKGIAAIGKAIRANCRATSAAKNGLPCRRRLSAGCY